MNAQNQLPPDASQRDAARRETLGEVEESICGDDFRFVTRNVSHEDKAAVIAVLTGVRAEETDRVKRVDRIERQPWARSQRVPEGIADLLHES